MCARRPLLLAAFAAACVAVCAPASAATVAGDSVRVVGLQTDAASSPMGIDDAHPRFTWRLGSGRRGVVQSAYEVVVTHEGRPLWDSGKVASADQAVSYAGPSLASHTRYGWRVQVWDERGVPTAPVSSAFETAFMSPSEWQASWIKGTLTDCTTRDQCPAPLLRTEFDVSKPVARARLYASGLGYGVYRIDGQRVGDAVLDPAYTDYMDRVDYVTRDVTALLHRGRNAIGAELGRGYFGMALGKAAYRTGKTAAWHAEPELRLELWITYADGTQQLVKSDPSTWRTTDGPTRFDDLMYGETYDARRAAQLSGWAQPGFDDSAWSPAPAAPAPKGSLQAMNEDPVRVQQVLPFKSVRKVADDTYLFDLGQNIAGNVSLHGDLPDGQKLTMTLGEQLDANGRVVPISSASASGSTPFQVDEYVAGAGPDDWTPQFSYAGFQYVEVQGLTQAPSLDLLTAQVWSNSMPRVGSWRSSDELVNRIVDAANRAFLSNQMTAPTDCPQFEKGPYTGDGQLVAPSIAYLFDNHRFLAKWSQDIGDSVFPSGQMDWVAPTGNDPGSSPLNGNNALTPGWDAALFTVPETIWQQYGDDRPLTAELPEMETYRDLISKVGASGIIPEGGASGASGPAGSALAGTPLAPAAQAAQLFAVFGQTGLGDWAPVAGAPFDVSIDSTAWYFRMMQILELAATRAGDSSTASDAAQLEAQIRTAFNARFWDPANLRYADTPGVTTGTQHDNALAAGLGLADGPRLQQAGDALAADMHARGDHVFAGIMGTRFLFPVLSDTGHTDEAWAFLNQTTYPSYGYWLSKGWTSLAEGWEDSARSINHQMYGSFVQWLFEDIAGYRPLKPGFEEIEFDPHIPGHDADWVSASTRTVRGVVATRWRKTRQGLDLVVTVPAGSTGRVLIPATDAAQITESGEPLSQVDGLHVVGPSGDRFVVEVGSGTYRFAVAGR